MPIRIIKHEAVPQTGSFEVRFPDGRPSVYFYWDDIPGRRLRPQQMDSNRALEAARALAEKRARRGFSEFTDFLFRRFARLASCSPELEPIIWFSANHLARDEVV